MTQHGTGTPPESSGFFTDSLAVTDPDVHRWVCDEGRRQDRQIELIASENIVSAAVLDALGSVLTNKYAEGYPGRRYYGGCVHVDEVEACAIDRARRLFDAGFCQTCSPTPAPRPTRPCSWRC